MEGSIFNILKIKFEIPNWHLKDVIKQVTYYNNSASRPGVEYAREPCHFLSIKYTQLDLLKDCGLEIEDYDNALSVLIIFIYLCSENHTV